MGKVQIPTTALTHCCGTCKYFNGKETTVPTSNCMMVPFLFSLPSAVVELRAVRVKEDDGKDCPAYYPQAMFVEYPLIPNAKEYQSDPCKEQVVVGGAEEYQFEEYP